MKSHSMLFSCCWLLLIVGWLVGSLFYSFSLGKSLWIVTFVNTQSSLYRRKTGNVRFHERSLVGLFRLAEWRAQLLSRVWWKLLGVCCVDVLSTFSNWKEISKPEYVYTYLLVYSLGLVRHLFIILLEVPFYLTYYILRCTYSHV